MKTIELVAAARPNFMKIAPLWFAFAKEPWAKVRIVHTGQHYDFDMSDVFFQEFGLPTPHVHLGIGGGTHGQQTGRVLEAFEAHLLESRPDLVIVVGDVNATPAAALAAVKLGIPVAHLEAGLRSFDRTMPEEINRIITDDICDLLWTPSEDADAHLLRQSIPPKRIERVGNIMIDTLVMLQGRIGGNPVLADWGLQEKSYGVVTLHRPSNVDAPEQMELIVDQLLQCAKQLPLVFPVHPRTRANLEKFGMWETLQNSPFTIVGPQPYLAFMRLVTASRAVITDSGGVQEETSYVGIPCLTLRENTERPVTITHGTNRLVKPEQLATCLCEALEKNVSPANIPLWDGKTAGRVVKSVERFFMQGGGHA